MSFAIGKKVLVVVSHQDDESLFFGGLLTSISGASELTVVCMSEAKQKRDVEGRNAFFRNACQIVDARPVLTSFRDARHVWSHVDLFFRKRPEQVEAMRKFLQAQAVSLRPDIVVTHNEQGEYGHCYHKVVHRVCCQVFDPRKLYFVGRGSRRSGQQIVVEYDAEKKKRLMDCYPTFDAATFSKRFFREVITYQPETYIAAGDEKPKATAPSILRVDSELTRDFLHFFHRKLRAKVGWW
jgi:LmbE family N-acetylglucosaminyl deacetylase